MKKTYILSIILSAALSSCTLFGLDYQDSYDYDDSTFNPNTGMSVMDYMRSKPELFSSMLEAIEYAELEQEYSNPNRTYLLLTNHALSDIRYVPTTVAAEVGSYFVCNKVPNPNYDPANTIENPEYLIAKSWTEYPKEQVASFLKYHILIGKQTWETGPSKTKEWIKTVAYETEENADTCLVLFNITNGTLTTGGTKMSFNGWEAIQPGNLYKTRKTVGPLYSDLFCTDGTVQVINDYLVAPARQIVETTKYDIQQ